MISWFRKPTRPVYVSRSREPTIQFRDDAQRVEVRRALVMFVGEISIALLAGPQEIDDWLARWARSKDTAKGNAAGEPVATEAAREAVGSTSCSAAATGG